jgi:hypothetical protein
MQLLYHSEHSPMDEAVDRRTLYCVHTGVIVAQFRDDRAG